jgi:hypothetical protein
MWQWLLSLFGGSGGAAGTASTAKSATSMLGGYGQQVGNTLQSLTTKEGMTNAVLTQGKSVQQGMTPSFQSGKETEGALAPAGNAAYVPEATSQTAPASQQQAAQLTGTVGPSIPQAGVVPANQAGAAQASAQSDFSLGNVLGSLMGDSESFGQLLGTDRATAEQFMAANKQSQQQQIERQRLERERALSQSWRF